MINIDYLQPDFYRFNEDSLKLVRFVSSKNLICKRAIDLCSGCGVIGIELALKLPVQEIELLELQPDFEYYLQQNVKLFIPDKKSQIIISSLRNFRSERKYDLIVANPPYYLPGHGQVSPNRQRHLCRTFAEDGWTQLLQFIADHLNENGNAFIVVKNQPEILRHIRNHVTSYLLKIEESIEGDLCFLQLSLLV